MTFPRRLVLVLVARLAGQGPIIIGLDDTIDRRPRRDETRTLSLSVHNRAVTVLGFSPRLSLIREERDTNAQALDYKRNRAELSFVRQF